MSNRKLLAVIGSIAVAACLLSLKAWYNERPKLYQVTETATAPMQVTLRVIVPPDATDSQLEEWARELRRWNNSRQYFVVLFYLDKPKGDGSDIIASFENDKLTRSTD